MTNTLKRFIAVAVLLVATAPLGARAAVSVYAEDIPGSTIAPTNPPAAEAGVGGAKTSDADHPPVRIDETGVHVGGPNPVDINVPDFARGHKEWGMNGAILTGMLAVLGSFGMPMAIILIVFYFRHRRNRMAHETLRAMIEKGVPITPELVAQIRDNGCSGSKDGLPRKRLLPGLILTGVGLALLMDGHKYDNRGGWILVFMGAAFLIVWFVESRNQNNSQPPR